MPLELTDLKSVDGESVESREVDKVVGAARSGADMVVRGEEEEEGDVFIQLYHLVAVELVVLCSLDRQQEGKNHKVQAFVFLAMFI